MLTLFRNSLLFCFTCLIIAQAIGNTENNKLRFTRLSVKDGLSQSTVYSIRQDHKGFLWIATADGLNKYDGYTFSVYQHKKNDSTSIQSSLIRSLCFDDTKRLWVGTGTGLSLFNRENNTFTNYYMNDQVNAIYQETPQYLLIATTNGFFRFDMKNGSYIPLLPETMNNLQGQVIVKHNNRLLFGTNHGLYMSLMGENNFVIFHQVLSGLNIMDILPSSKGVWVATEGNGLFFIDNIGKYKQYRHDNSNPRSISSNYVRCLCFDTQNRLFAGTFVGLNVFNESADNFDCYYSNEVEQETIAQNSVRSLFPDNQGAIWIGTYYGGLNYYHPLQNRFGRISHLPFHNSLSDNVVSCMTEGKTEELWIGTNDNGLNVYDIGKKKFTYYNATGKPNEVIASNNVKAILYNRQSVYIGTHGGGLSILDRNTGRATIYNTNNSALTCNDIYSLISTSDGKIWLGTLCGLFLFDPKTKSFSVFPEDDLGQKIAGKSVFFLLSDSRNRIWIGTKAGIFIYSSTDKKLLFHHTDNSKGLSDPFVNCVFEDSKKRIWIGTRNGLNMFQEETCSFISYTTEDGLPNNTVFGILQDSFERLWISTNKGLACFTPETEKFRTYTLTDGLQGDQFNNYAYCKTSNGEMFFGGINGITHFYPERLIDNPFTPETIITQFNLFNKPVSPNDGTHILSKDISETTELSLKPSQLSFSLTFTVLNFLSSKHNTFAYKLEPFDIDWNYTTDIRTVSYSFLPHGNYHFKVKAANSDGKWNDTPTVLFIKVLPHWWETIWAKGCFVFIFIIAVYSILRFISHRQSLKNQLELERLEREKTEEVNQMKLRFFINISHEFRTPLSLIISPLQEMTRRITDKWTRDQLKLVQRNTNKLLYLVNQLMDYRRAELGVFELKVTYKNPDTQVKECMAMFEQLSKQKKIDFVLENLLADKITLYDPHYFELILNNLLSNAFKFTPDGGRIEITLSCNEDDFMLKVADTGCGLSKDQKDKIFNRFYQVNADNVGTGIGLSLVKRLTELHHGRIIVESEQENGSIFTLYLPQNEAVYSNNELADEGEETIRTSISEEEVDLIRSPEEMKCALQNDENRSVILLVEDDIEVRDYLANQLKEFFNIVVAGDGEEALKLTKEQEIDIILTDVMLPVMDGIKLCKAIKQNIRICHIPVIMLTAKTTQQDQLEGLKAGADDYVHKPFNLSILKTKIQNMLKSRRRTLEHYSQTLEVNPDKITFNVMDQELLEKAKNIVEKNLSNVDFSVDEFSKEMAMSRSNLHLKLKAITGESTIDFIRKIRFSHASRLLKDGHYSIAEISSMVGFNTPSYFTTSFKKYFGVLPTDYNK